MNKEVNKIFSDWLDSLPVKEFKEKKNLVISNCFINYRIYFNWKAGITPIPIIYFEKINNIAGYELLKIENNENN